MSIVSSAFGGVTLTGEDAKKFLRQVRYGRPKKEAIEAAKRGSALLDEMQRNGSVRVTIRKNTGRASESNR